MKYHQEIDDLFELTHEPLNPPRDGIIGEHIYAAMWKGEMAGQQDKDGHFPIQYVLSGFPFPINPRHATVLASVVCWLGTNCGQSFLREAEKLGDELPRIKHYERFLVAWVLHNSRRSFINGGIRTLEHCMTPYKDQYPAEMFACDYEVAEFLMLWLGSAEGQNFLENCKASYDDAIEKQRKRRLADFFMRQQEAA